MTSFKTRARAVDMLGRQQIAGIPTAISELFKNAHDAYADQAIVDFFRSDNLFVLRDDGVGMSEKDFEDRWLTLGTEGKSDGGGDVGAPPKRAGYGKRPTLGEKGIGRLAIAAIGPQMLMLSRSLEDSKPGGLVVAFLNWGLFEFPSANLEDIEIPTITIEGGLLPSRDEVGTLVDWAGENLSKIAGPKDRQLVTRVKSELKDFRSIDPQRISEQLGAPSLREGSGTHFIIQPASTLLSQELDSSVDTTSATPLRRLLVGFANTMTPDHADPAVRTSFRDHYSEDSYEDVIGESEFFTPAEFASADHHIQGEFDAFGQFRGSVAVYGGEPDAYTVSWPNARGAKTKCGPFRLDLAYVQGSQRDSRLSPEEFVEIGAKLNRYGGLYIYRDNVRVLPYGNSDFDFLDIEVRRAKSASDAFFSYRRMFGVVELSRSKNASLREKAGREGFADNEAYRQFRTVLQNFLYQVAVDYFRESGNRSERFWNERSELNRLDRARTRRGKQVRVRRRALSASLEGFFERVESETPELAVNEVVSRFSGRLAAAGQQPTPSEVVDLLVGAEADALRDVEALADEYQIVRPRGVGLTKEQTRLWMGYESERARLDAEVFGPAVEEVNKRASEALKGFEPEASRRARFDSAISSAVDRGRKDVAAARRELESVSKESRSNAVAVVKEAAREFDSIAQEVVSAAASLNLASLSDSKFVRERSRSERDLQEVASKYVEVMGALVAQFATIEFSTPGSEAVSYLDQVEAMETDLEALRDQSERDMELVQLGAAISVINHEFDETITSMRRSLRRFKSWSDANPALREPYRDLRSSFEHLDGYLKLFTPLNRRLYRSRVEMTGAEIAKYLSDVFDRRLQAQSIVIEPTRGFVEAKFEQYPSVIYPVFVNLIDNAIFWLSDFRGRREIVLEARGPVLVVRDSGPGVPERDRDAIFEYGFSRKPGGSGVGLHISRSALEREGWSLELTRATGADGAEFTLGPLDDAK